MGTNFTPPSAQELVPEATRQALWLVLDGQHLNGHVEAIHPLYRAIIAALEQVAGSKAERVSAMLALLRTGGFSDVQLGELETDLLSRGAGGRKARTERPAIEILSRAQLRDRPKPTWLVEGHLQRKSLACLFGPSGIGKSVLALSLAACCATGKPWFGRTVQHGNVVYVAAEGDDDYDNRLAAWEAQYHGSRMIEHFSLIPQAIDLRSPAAAALVLAAVREVAAADPVLVVIDTVARNMTGDENSTEHMSTFVRQADVLWRETGATVLLVHHTGKDGTAERGNSALRAAATSMLRLVREEDTKVLKLSCDKQKNGREFGEWKFVMKEVADSVVLDLAAGFKWLNRLPPVQHKVLDVLGWALHADGMTANRLLAALGVRTEGERVNVYRSLGKLFDQELIAKGGGPRSQVFTITGKGRDLLATLAADGPATGGME
jgi:KaiC/GvpD/RAD55 family RecA-like ATPase